MILVAKKLMETNVKSSKRFSFGSYALRAIIAAVVATILNIIVFLIGNSAGAFPDSIKVMAESSLEISNVVMMSVLGAIVGVLVFAAVGSFKIFRIIAFIVFLLFIYTPFSVANASTSFIIYLEVMHVVALIVTLWVTSWNKRA